MKKNISLLSIAAVTAVCVFIFAGNALAYWIWTPQTKKFINPKWAVKDSPKEQYDWAMGFYEAKDYKRSAIEFEKLTKSYEYSEYAARAQYHVGLSYEKQRKYYTAFLHFQKTIDNYPHIENVDEIVGKEVKIADFYMGKPNPKVMGADIMPPFDRSVEIYKKVVDNAPFGKYADEAQFKLGLALKKMDSYEEAMEAFQKVIDNYQTSQWYDKAKFELADCANRASLK
ncbi:MAG: tetratricopeptide repeat protein, partial [Candidatus Omnitrophota bacterium]